MTAPLKLDPLVMKERMVRSYLQSYERAGIEMTQEQVEQQVVADCELVDAARAAGELSGAPKADATPEPQNEKPDLVAIAAAENKLELGPRGQKMRPRSLYWNPQKVTERWGYAVGRIKRILEGTRKDTSSLIVAVEDAELRALATEYAELWSNYMTRAGKVPAGERDPNPFRNDGVPMNDRDASRKFMRMVEDICDRSTGKLGSWYVK